MAEQNAGGGDESEINEVLKLVPSAQDSKRKTRWDNNTSTATNTG